MKRRWISLTLGLLVLALLVAGVWRALSARQAQQGKVAQLSANKTEAAIELTATDLIVASGMELTQSIAVSGGLRAAQSASVKARVAGELQDLRVREGDSVRAGQVVARVEPSDAKARLRQAQDQAAAAKAQLDGAQRQWDNNKALVEQGFISRTALDLSLSSFNTAQATHQAALAAVDLARKAVEDTELRAPISGLVSARLAQPGERVGIDARVIEIIDIEQLEVEASLAPGDAASLRTGQVAQLRVEGLTEAVSARVLRISPSAQAGSRTVTVYLGVAGRAGLRQGLFASGHIQVGVAQGIGLPISAVRTDKPQPYVQVVEGGRIAHRGVLVIARGDSGDEPYALVQGLEPDTSVVRGEVGSLRVGTLARNTATRAASGAASGAASAASQNPTAARPASAASAAAAAAQR